MFGKILVFGLLITFCGTLNLFAQDDDCYTHAYVIDDKAPKLLNDDGKPYRYDGSKQSLIIRDQPNLKGKVLATVKTMPKDSDREGIGFISVVITGYSNGWWKITSAHGDDDSSYEGIGWVSAQLASWSMNYATDKPINLYAASNSKRKIGTIPAEREVLVIGFTCGWVKVKFKTKIGWARTSNICGAAVTSCS